jgi:hypothetical protein
MSADDQKTRVLQRRQGAAPPEIIDGKIVFHCPNGDRVVVPVALAGKRGKCSKCGIDVTIPKLGETPPAQEEVPAAPAPAPAAAAPEPSPEPPAVTAPEATPATAPEPIPEAPVAAAPPAGGEARGGAGWDFIAGQSEQSAVWMGGDAAGGFVAEGGNATAALVGRLWAERQHGGVIELHLAGGSVILPEWYDANWSRGTHGLFASQAADGSVTLTAVAWETVQKIVVRQLTEVPDDMFA